MEWNVKGLVAGVAATLMGVALTNGCSSTNDNGPTSPVEAGVPSSAEAGAPCTAGAKECVTPQLARVCPADGSGWLSITCGSGQTCDGGECKAVPTAPGTCLSGPGACLSATSALRCKADFKGYESIDCPAGTTCQGQGLCVGACTVGSSRCLDNKTLATCGDGLSQTLTSCGAGEACVRVSSGPVVQSACKPAACIPTSCNRQCGNILNPAADQTKFMSECVETPTGYQWSALSCPANKTCSPACNASCTGQCTPGTTRCGADGLGIQTCAADGTWGTSASCNPDASANSLVCMPKPNTFDQVICGDPLCASGAAGTCAAGGIKRCGPDGRIAAAAAACAQGTCKASLAAPPVAGIQPGDCVVECKPGEERCVGGPTFQTCNNGVWGPLADCPGGANCFAYTAASGGRTKVCGGECAPGSKRCRNADAGAGNEGIQVCGASATWGPIQTCSVGTCKSGVGAVGAACVADCIPNVVSCADGSAGVPGTGYRGRASTMTCSATGTLTPTVPCGAGTVCRTRPDGTTIMAGTAACLQCVGSGVMGGNENGLVDRRCQDATTTQLCGADNTWSGAATACTAPATCKTSTFLGAQCRSGNWVPYATAKLPSGTKNLVFVAVPSGTTFTSNADYANFCTSNGFAQNRNSSSGSASAGNYDPTNYYCGHFCCFLGNGNSEARNLTNFQNFGLPTGVPLQVIDRGCGVWCSGTFTGDVNTTDRLTLTSDTTFTYNPNGSNYCSAKTVSTVIDGVVVCEEP